MQQAILGRADLDLVLLPAESVNDDGLFIDSMSLESLAASVSCDVRVSRDFSDALQEPAGV
jgi:hypothetical protein